MACPPFNVSFGQAPRVGRRLDGTLFDLQITERPQRGSWNSEKGDAPPRTVVTPVSDGVPGWSVDLSDDLLRAGPVRDYLLRWGPSRQTPALRPLGPRVALRGSG